MNEKSDLDSGTATVAKRRSSPPPSLDVSGYGDLIERLAAQKLNQRISNGVPAHAAILLETMFRHAEEEIRIYTGKLDGDTYAAPALIREAKRFLRRPGTCLRVLLQERRTVEWAKEQPFIKQLLDTPPGLGTFEVRCARGIYATDKAKHFSVMDGTGYRFEVDHAKTRAVANFNEPEVARDFSSAFDRAYEIADPDPLVVLS